MDKIDLDYKLRVTTTYRYKVSIWVGRQEVIQFAGSGLHVNHGDSPIRFCSHL